SRGMPRPAVTFSRKGSTSSGFSGPPNDSSKSASYGRASGVGTVSILPARRSRARLRTARRLSHPTPRLGQMLSPYRKLLATRGALSFEFAGFLARLPISTMTLGIVLLVAGRTGSYGRAGVITAFYMVASGVSGPMLARFIDQLGQRRVLGPAF